MSMADLDGDGDLDIVINNLATRARLFENRLCGGDHLQIDLRWPAAANRYALGARVYLDISTGSYLRTVRAASGYLSGDHGTSALRGPAGQPAAGGAHHLAGWKSVSRFGHRPGIT